MIDWPWFFPGPGRSHGDRTPLLGEIVMVVAATNYIQFLDLEIII